MKFLLAYYFFTLYIVIIESAVNNSYTTTVGLYQLFNKFINQCNEFDDVVKCFKVQGIKIVDNASKTNRIGNIYEIF